MCIFCDATSWRHMSVWPNWSFSSWLKCCHPDVCVTKVPFPFVNNKYSEIVCIFSFLPFIQWFYIIEDACLSQLLHWWLQNCDFLILSLILQLLAGILLFERVSPLSPFLASYRPGDFFSSSGSYAITIILFGLQRVPGFSSGSPFFYILFTCSFRLWSLGLLSGRRCSRLMSYLTCFQIWYQRPLQGALIIFSGG